MRFVADHKSQIGKRVCKHTATRALDKRAAHELFVGGTVSHAHFRTGREVAREAFSAASRGERACKLMHAGTSL